MFPGRFLATLVPRRSVWPIFPRILPHGLVMPSMAKTEPLGLCSIAMDGLPVRSVYWVAICPLAARARTSASVAMNFPSPCENGTLWRSPTLVLASQGDLVEAMRVVA